MDIEVRAIDPHDDGALAAHHAVSVATTAHDVPDFPEPCPVEYTGALRYPKRTSKKLAWVAYAGGEPVGTLDLDLPLLDNTGNADVEIRVAPAHRRRGVGRILHAQAVAAARAPAPVRPIGGAVPRPPGRPAPRRGRA